MKLPYSITRYVIASALILLVFPAIGEVLEKHQEMIVLDHTNQIFVFKLIQGNNID